MRAARIRDGSGLLRAQSHGALRHMAVTAPLLAWFKQPEGAKEAGTAAGKSMRKLLKENVKSKKEVGLNIQEAILRDEKWSRPGLAEPKNIDPSVSRFRNTVASMHKKYKTEGKFKPAWTAKTESKAKETLASRKRMLVFREVDNELDKPIVTFDYLIWWQWLRSGTASIIDAALERELRYFNESAKAEIWVCPKLFDGPDELMVRARRFPTFNAWKMEQAVDKSNPTVTVSSASFTKPTMITLAQLLPDPKNEETQWLELVPESCRHIDKVRLFSIDKFSTSVAQGMAVNANLQFFKEYDKSHFYVGDRIVRQFYEDFSLRNFLSTYCFLVDCTGRIRWMSAGLPTDREKDLMKAFLPQLELEYMKERMKRAS